MSWHNDLKTYRITSYVLGENAKNLKQLGTEVLSWPPPSPWGHTVMQLQLVVSPRLCCLGAGTGAEEEAEELWDPGPLG
jgi:hypothetical protein